MLLLCDPSLLSQRHPRTTAAVFFPSHHRPTAGLRHPRNQLCCPSLKQLFAQVLPFLWLGHPRRRRANPAPGLPSLSTLCVVEKTTLCLRSPPKGPQTYPATDPVSGHLLSSRGLHCVPSVSAPNSVIHRRVAYPCSFLSIILSNPGHWADSSVSLL